MIAPSTKYSAPINCPISTTHSSSQTPEDWNFCSFNISSRELFSITVNFSDLIRFVSKPWKQALRILELTSSPVKSRMLTRNLLSWAHNRLMKQIKIIIFSPKKIREGKGNSVPKKQRSNSIYHYLLF